MKRLITVAITAALTITFAAPAFAADYSLDAVDRDSFYNSTLYEEVYGSQYNYGGVNAVDIYDVTRLPGIFTLLPENAPPSGEYVYAEIGAESVGYTVSAAAFRDDSVSSDFTVTTGGYTVGTGSAITAAVPAFTSSSTLVRPDGSIGTLEIPSLGINVKVFEGTGSGSLAKGLGHFPETTGWNGNIAVAGHNRGAKYTIGAIKDLKQGDVIRYTTLLGTRTYTVNFVGYISNTDMTYLAPTADNRITLITCLAGQPDLRVAVQAVEVK